MGRTTNLRGHKIMNKIEEMIKNKSSTEINTILYIYKIILILLLLSYNKYFFLQNTGYFSLSGILKLFK